jgi:hypothetical protein
MVLTEVGVFMRQAIQCQHPTKFRCAPIPMGKNKVAGVALLATLRKLDQRTR